MNEDFLCPISCEDVREVPLIRRIRIFGRVYDVLAVHESVMKTGDLRCPVTRKEMGKHIISGINRRLKRIGEEEGRSYEPLDGARCAAERERLKVLAEMESLAEHTVRSAFDLWETVLRLHEAERETRNATREETERAMASFESGATERVSESTVNALLEAEGYSHRMEFACKTVLHQCMARFVAAVEIVAQTADLGIDCLRTPVMSVLGKHGANNAENPLHGIYVAFRLTMDECVGVWERSGRSHKRVVANSMPRVFLRHLSGQAGMRAELRHAVLTHRSAISSHRLQALPQTGHGLPPFPNVFGTAPSAATSTTPFMMTFPGLTLGDVVERHAPSFAAHMMPSRNDDDDDDDEEDEDRTSPFGWLAPSRFRVSQQASTSAEDREGLEGLSEAMAVIMAALAHEEEDE